jgi:hypothetical protein
MIGPNKIEHYVALGWKGMPAINNLAYVAHSYDTGKKYCEYTPCT